ncbi:MAG: hypothetical protein ACLGIF_06770 [Actinomycetes bacterium]
MTLLGPQRKVAAARAAVAELMPEGPVATINAGWQEREADVAELAGVLGGRMLNLELYRRWTELTANDPGYTAAERRLQLLLDELQVVYALRLRHAMAAWEEVNRRNLVLEVQRAAVEDAVAVVGALDRWHLRAVAQAREEFYAQVRPGERDSVARHRAEVADLVGRSAGLVVTGGHVGVLLHLLHVFGLATVIRPPVVAWSAGAMALSERVVLYSHVGPVGRRHPEVYADGLAAYGGVLPFPHARRRLPLDDAEHLGLIARRFAPSACLLLGDGERVDLVEGKSLPPGVRVLTEQGAQLVTGR